MRVTKKNLIFVFLLLCVFVFVNFSFAYAQVANVENPYYFVIVSEGGQDNPFVGAMEKGADDAAELLGDIVKFYRPQKEGDLAWQLDTLKSLLVDPEKIDGIVTSIAEANMFDDVIQEAIDLGIPVITMSTDDPEGADGNARLAFIGQDYVTAGYIITKETLTRFFKDAPPKHILFPVEVPGVQYSLQRGEGMERALEEFGIKSYEFLETTMDPVEAESRIMAYLSRHPETEAIISVGGIAFPPAARAAERMGYKPGEIKITGFDVMPPIIDQMRKGYIQLTLDQQPYLQGFIPILQLHLMKKYGFAAWDQNTGNYVVTEEGIDLIEKLAPEKIRL